METTAEQDAVMLVEYELHLLKSQVFSFFTGDACAKILVARHGRKLSQSCTADHFAC